MAESCILGGVGARIDAPIAGRWDAALFGEAQSRIVVSLAPEKLGDFRDVCEQAGAPWAVIGAVGGDSMAVSGLADIPVSGTCPRPGTTASTKPRTPPNRQGRGKHVRPELVEGSKGSAPLVQACPGSRLPCGYYPYLSNTGMDSAILRSSALSRGTTVLLTLT